MASKRIPSLDGLRAISIVLVIISHLEKNLVAHSQIQGSALISHVFSALGNLGVTVFFVISGYLITSLLFSELAKSGSIQLGRFYLRRTLRLMPAYYFLILIVAVGYGMGLIEASHWQSSLWHALTYTANYSETPFWYFGHGWSLSVEEQFYLLWPAALLLLGKRKGLVFAGALLIICPLVRLYYQLAVDELPKWMLLFRFESVADALATGCLLAGFRTWLKRQPSYTAILASPFFGVVPLLVVLVSIAPVWLMIGEVDAFFLLKNTVVNLTIAICIDWCIAHPDGVAGKVLNSRPFVYVGVMSYSIYLWQQPFLNPDQDWFIAQFPRNIILVMIASLASYYWIERPSLALREKIESRLRKRRDGVPV